MLGVLGSLEAGPETGSVVQGIWGEGALGKKWAAGWWGCQEECGLAEDESHSDPKGNSRSHLEPTELAGLGTRC